LYERQSQRHYEKPWNIFILSIVRML
jgi:hypothetical protein